VFCGFPGWAPGRVAKLQCDFSAMISPQMFRDFVAPYLRRQCQRLDHTFYHLDGPGATGHLSALLEIPELGGIQWTPGAGAPGVQDAVWWPMYHQIEKAGKRLFLLGMPPAAVPTIAAEFDSNLLLISTWAGTEEEARRLTAAL
jgi:5-methyltetrahydrofolate--homocysteine methyltransferase